MDADLLAQLKAPDHVQVELWSRTGTPIADITHLVRNYYAVEERNEAEQLQFSMDLDAFEDYMLLKVGADPVSNFREGQTEIIVKEDGEFKFGTQLQWAPINLNKDGSATISVTATGYLNFFNDRYPDPTIPYTQIDPVEIARDLIRKAQTVTYGNYGVQLPSSGYYVTGKLRDRSYAQYTASTKLSIQRLTPLKGSEFDFKFLAGKQFMTYAAIGSPRSDFKIVYDRTSNRSTFDYATINRGASQLFNRIIGLGSGTGQETMTSIRTDVISANEYGLREDPFLNNDVSVQSTLNENTEARLARVKDLVRMPQVTLSEADLPEAPVSVGDIVTVQFKGRRLLEDASGSHRIERIETKRDINNFKSEVTIYHQDPRAGGTSV